MKTSFKKLTCLFLSILMLMSIAVTGVSAAVVDTNPTAAEIIYVDARTLANDMTFFAWKWEKPSGSGSWYTMTNNNGIYELDFSTSENCCIVAFPLNTTTPDWSTMYGQTSDVNDYTGDYNCLIVTAGGEKGLAHEWATYKDGVVTPTEEAPTLSGMTSPTTKATEPETTIPTFATEPDENEALYVAVQSNLDLTGVKTKTTGNLISVSYYLTADQIIDGGQAVITYDTKKLGLSAKYNTAATMFPVLTGVSYNLASDIGEAMFNFSGINNDFKNGGVFVNLVFERKYLATGTAEVWVEVTDLTSKDTTYVEDDVINTTNGITFSAEIKDTEGSTSTVEPVETDATTDIKVKVDSNIQNSVTDISVDKANVRVTFDLTVAEALAFGNAVVYFDDTMLALEDRFNTLETMFPVISNVSYNLNAAQGAMKFAFTGVDAENNKGLFDFSAGGTLVTLVFTVKSGATGTANIKLDVENLGTMTKDYVEDFSVNPGVTGTATGAPEEATASPTEPTSAPDVAGTPTIPVKTEPTESSETTPTPSATESEPTTESTAPTTESTAPTTETTEPTTDGTEPTTEAPAPKLTVKKVKLSAGATTKASVSNTNGKKVTYKSTKTKVAKIDAKGNITALSKGTTTIKATVGGKTLTKKVTVKNNPTIKNGKKAVKNNQTFKVKKNKSLTLTIKGKAKKIANKVTTSNKKVAKITSKANKTKVTIKGLKKGTAKIKIKINNAKTYTIKVKVQ